MNGVIVVQQGNGLPILTVAILMLVGLVIAALYSEVEKKETSSKLDEIQQNYKEYNAKPVDPIVQKESDLPSFEDETSEIETDVKSWDYYRGQRVYEAVNSGRVAIDALEDEHFTLLIDFLIKNPHLRIDDRYLDVEQDKDYDYKYNDNNEPFYNDTYRSYLTEDDSETGEGFRYYHQTDNNGSEEYIGRLSSNPYSGYDNPYDPNSINNPYGKYGSPYSPNSANNPYATDTPKLYDSEGNYRGRLSNNPYDPDSISNPYGQYGSQYSPDSINNPYGAGSPYQYDSPNNPYGTGWSIVGSDD
jgi:hypothetical protein